VRDVDGECFIITMVVKIVRFKNVFSVRRQENA
jgi:hypothetical protein